MLLGDAFAIFLASYNIKKTDGCNCGERQRKWNAFGERHPIINFICVATLQLITRKSRP